MRKNPEQSSFLRTTPHGEVFRLPQSDALVNTPQDGEAVVFSLSGGKKDLSVSDDVWDRADDLGYAGGLTAGQIVEEKRKEKMTPEDLEFEKQRDQAPVLAYQVRVRRVEEIRQKIARKRQ